jgi:hypothetical protein
MDPQKSTTHDTKTHFNSTGTITKKTPWDSTPAVSFNSFQHAFLTEIF